MDKSMPVTKCPECGQGLAMNQPAPYEGFTRNIWGERDGRLAVTGHRSFYIAACGQCRLVFSYEVTSLVHKPTGAIDAWIEYPDMENSDSFTEVFLFEPQVRKDRITEELDHSGWPVEGRRCHHSYDCCGNFYTGGIDFPRRKSVKDPVRAEFGWYRNV